MNLLLLVCVSIASVTISNLSAFWLLRLDPRAGKAIVGKDYNAPWWSFPLGYGLLMIAAVIGSSCYHNSVAAMLALILLGVAALFAVLGIFNLFGLGLWAWSRLGN